MARTLKVSTINVLLGLYQLDRGGLELCQVERKGSLRYLRRKLKNRWEQVNMKQME